MCAIRIVRFLAAIFIISLLQVPAAHAQGVMWGRVDTDSANMIGFRVIRNNVPGSDFTLTIEGECTYDNAETAANTFSFGGGEFPDLLLRRTGRINAEFEAQSDTGHIGTLAIDCTFSGNDSGRRNFSRARCNVSFDSPVRPGEQLDACVAGASFSRIRRSRQ